MKGMGGEGAAVTATVRVAWLLGGVIADVPLGE